MLHIKQDLLVRENILSLIKIVYFLYWEDFIVRKYVQSRHLTHKNMENVSRSETLPTDGK